VYNQSLILNENPQNEAYMLSAMGEKNDFILAYTPTGTALEIDLSQMNAETVKGYWFNPRSGSIQHIGDFKTREPTEFKPWSGGWGSDFLLILVDADSSYSFEGFKK